ncbi:MAG: ChaB family protein [Bacteroidota bacterium]
MEATLPYRSPSGLPESVRNVLPPHAQEIYMEAFNSAWEQYDRPEECWGESSGEETAHRVVWSAVKSKIIKDEETGK